jgi:predicted acylesterase/phospholipase RssA
VVIAGAMLMGILNLGMRDAFDAIYGASAGAINSTYFLSGKLMQPFMSSSMC